MTNPNLLILDDNEGVLAKAPALEKLKALANITIFDRPIAPDDDLSPYQLLFALRERTLINSDLLDRFQISNSYCNLVGMRIILIKRPLQSEVLWLL